jgi:hypothetical protein
MNRFVRLSFGLAAAVVMTLGAFGTAGANSNSQTVLSATGVLTTGGPAGFWIWSQPGTANAYGNEGAGSIYFYALLPAEHPVDVSGVTVSGNTVTETVVSTDGLITCSTFTGTETSPGVGTVSFTCMVTKLDGTLVKAVATNVPAQVNISSNP